MTKEKTSQTPVALRPKYKMVAEEPPKVSHIVNFHRVGTDVLMTVGRIDIAELATRFERLRAEKEAPPEELEFEVEVFDRFAMSPDAFARLVFNAQQIFEAMVKSGHLKVEEASGEE
jgi:hypothetical protein